MKQFHVTFFICLSFPCMAGWRTSTVIEAQEVTAKPIKLLPWLATRELGMRDAQQNKRPMLIRFGGDNCAWCRRLHEEIEKPAVQQGLKRWTLVVLDVDRSAADARAFHVESIPALRVASSAGRLLEWHDGYLAEEDLIEWLDQSFERAGKSPDEVLMATTPPTPLDVRKLVRQFSERNPAEREAAIRRLRPYPQDAAEAVVGAFRQEKLSVRLAALELLREWKAPLDDLDPWRPETMTAERLSRFDEWLTTIPAQHESPRELTPEEFAAARDEIEKSLTSDAATAAAIRERLARFKGRLLPEVASRLKNAGTDDVRSRLLALRYRLVMDDVISLRSPGLVERLAATDVKIRHQAVQELAEHAGAESQSLFLELFTDPDPLVRELSLQGLRTAEGDEGTSALIKLLDDPEPNVRAAVLKLFAENPWPELQPRLAAFLKQEKDTDLLVHAVRCFRKLKERSSAVLLPMLEHPDWQVRAEVLDIITGAWQRYHQEESRLISSNDEIRAAVLARLDDDDAFVVSRAIVGVSHVLTTAVIKKLVAIPEKHPSLTNDVIAVIGTATNVESPALTALKGYFKSPDAAVRAAAIHGLGNLAPNEIEVELLDALQDTRKEVRIAGAETLLLVLNGLRPNGRNSNWGSSIPDHQVDEDDEPADALAVANDPDADVVHGPAMVDDQDSKPDSVDAPPNGISLQAIARGLLGLFTGEPANTVDVPAESDEVEAKALDDRMKNAHKLGPKLDNWIRRFRSGKRRPEWLAKMLPPLKKMFASADSGERIASAVPLAALGKEEIVVPIAMDFAIAGDEAGLAAIDVLKWLTFDERQPLVKQLMKSPKIAEMAGKFLTVVSDLQDTREERLLWDLCDLASSEPQLIYSIHHGLQKLYFGERYWDPNAIPNSQKKRLFENARRQLSSPVGWRHILAMAMMLDSVPKDDSEEQIEIVRTAALAIAEDESLDSKMRCDAMQIALLTQTANERTVKMIEILKGSDPSLSLIALHVLTNENRELSSLPNSQIHLNARNDFVRRSYTGRSTNEAIRPEAPAGVTTEIVRPLMRSADAETRALAGYLLAVLDDPEGLNPLIEYWRLHSQDDQWSRLAYRAIAATDDGSRIQILKQIYKQLDDWEVKDFYWTIRIMTGPQVLDFRKQIRTERGASSLAN